MVQQILSTYTVLKVFFMAIHPDKSKCMLIATKQILKRGSTLLLNIGNTQIENVEAQKLLGIYR